MRRADVMVAWSPIFMLRSPHWLGLFRLPSKIHYPSMPITVHACLLDWASGSRLRFGFLNPDNSVGSQLDLFDEIDNDARSLREVRKPVGVEQESDRDAAEERAWNEFTNVMLIWILFDSWIKKLFFFIARAYGHFSLEKFAKRSFLRTVLIVGQWRQNPSFDVDH
jgi:hypothetical protein